MAVDPYSLCPCGSGKKLKFCCSDLVHEIEKIHQMMEGDQPRAALQHVEQTLAKHPGRESLLDLKAMLELSLDQLDAAAETIEALIESAPNNPAAHAQQAVLVASREGGRAAVVPLQQAMVLVGNDMPQRVLEAIGTVAQALLVEGNIIAARAHLWLYQGISGDEDTRALQLLVRLNQSAGLPLPLRDHLYMCQAPEGHPGDADHDRAQYYASLGQWLPAAQALDALCGLYPDVPAYAYNRGLVFGWLGDVQRFVQGMHDFAAGISQDAEAPLQEEAIEAEAIAQLLDAKLKDPPIDVVRLAYPVADEDSLLQRLAADRRVTNIDADPSELAGQDGPPPRGAYVLLDKPLPESGVDIQRDAIPTIVGFLSHYGRQTDRPERLELVIDKNDEFDAHIALLNEVTGDALQDAESEESVGESSAAEQALSWRWHFPVDTPPSRRRELLADQRREAILEKWPETPRTSLGGKTPREAQGDATLRLALAAAVTVLEQGTNNHKYAETFAELRQELGLPVPGEIDPSEVELDRLPLGRGTRLQMQKLSDDDLVSLYRRAAIAGAMSVVAHAAREAAGRATLHDRIPPVEAYQRMIDQEDDTDKAIALVGEARQAGEARGESSAIWDLMELELQIVEGQPEKANELLQHLRAEHIEEPGVAEQLYQLMYALGATPDQVPLPGGEAPAGEPQPAGAAEATGKIWTPDSETGGGGQKLWTPG